MIKQQNSNWVVTANNTNVFKNRLDQYWQHQDIIYDDFHQSLTELEVTEYPVVKCSE